jgi:nucleoid-associated protein YgaU
MIGEVAGLLKHGKAKLVRADAPAESGAGSALSSVISALPVPGSLQKDKDTELTFMFNPNEYTLKQSVEITRTPSKWQPGGKIEYLHTGPMTLSMKLFFDDFGSAKGDVTPKVNKLLEWQRPAGELQPPPFVKFEWSNSALENFTGIITSVSANYTVFRKDGTPLQAKVDITIEGTKTLAPGKNPTSHAVDMRRVHTLVEGETIQAIAFQELGRAEYWRAIAVANDIDDPLRVRPGQALLIPSAADAARDA